MRASLPQYIIHKLIINIHYYRYKVIYSLGTVCKHHNSSHKYCLRLRRTENHRHNHDQSPSCSHSFPNGSN